MNWVKIMTMAFAPAVDCNNCHVLSGLGAWNGPSDIKKCCIYILLSPNLLMNSGWLFTYLSEQMVRVSSASFGPLQAKTFCFEISLPLSSVAGMYEVKWRRITTEWHSPLGFFGYTSSSSCLSERFRNSVKESPSQDRSWKKKKRFFFWFTSQILISKDTIQCARN